MTSLLMMNINSQPVMVEAKGKELSKLPCKLIDETESIDIIFWGDQKDKVTRDFTYKLSNTRFNKCLSLNSESMITSAKLPLCSQSTFD